MLNNHQFEFESRAVYKALKRMSKDFSLQHAGFNYWRVEQSDTTLNPVDLSEGLQAHLDLSSQEKSSFMVALHAAMTQSVDALPEVPGALLVAAAGFAGVEENQEQEKFVAPSSAHMVMIIDFMKQCVLEIKQSGNEAYTEFQEILMEEQGDLSSDQWNVIKNWVSAGFTSLSIDPDISAKECSEYSHYIYLIMCETVGAVKADRSVNAIVERLQQHPEKANFNPSLLL